MAVDLDGTLTSRDRLSHEALDAISDARRKGLTVVLVTGRIEAELQADFPGIADYFDAVVLENGSVMVIRGCARVLAEPVDGALDDALLERRLPFRRGEALVAIDGEHATIVVDLIGELGLDCQIIRNRDALMVLPAGVTKGTGLRAVLSEVNLSPHNALAVGDAENDLSMFGVAEVGVAVSDAVPSVLRHADLVLDDADGTGLAGLLTGPYLTGARRFCPRRRWVDIGTFDDQSPARIPGSQGRILVTGPAGSGKSYLVGLMAERWIQAHYCVLVIDPEGDHVQLQQLNGVRVVDGGHHLPEPTELVTNLDPRTSLVVDLSGVPDPTKMEYLHRLRSTAEAHREQHGFPHWVIYDEAHLLGIDEEAHWARRGGYVLCSFAPAALPAGEIDSSDVSLTLADNENDNNGTEMGALRRAVMRLGSGPARPFAVADRQTEHVRHRRKYADVRLPDERRFYFHGVDGQFVRPAATMDEFRSAISHLDQRALQYHLDRGDFSRWLEGTIADRDFARQVAAWEDEVMARHAADVERVRRQLVHAVQERYLLSER
ncbi:phosphoglycolate phosphatase [Mycobacterium saskatchewanense]|uniref:HAD hydrolase family protein n=1 Tax=Mycobacterium saskatchewanense TaxID=220927 RepID=UPI00138B4ABE|nr:HAD hydrolase family protein [Mycobacterium saskatchewanense]BBX61240.1 phosphoglycolate phosphatase [Mycobacterium saskatchewanense]